jgi:hypothetical protein
MKKAILAIAIGVGLTPFAGNAKAQDLCVASNSCGVITNFDNGTNAHSNTSVGYSIADSNNPRWRLNASCLKI